LISLSKAKIKIIFIDARFSGAANREKGLGEHSNRFLKGYLKNIHPQFIISQMES